MSQVYKYISIIQNSIIPSKKYVVYDPTHNLKDGVEDGWIVAYYDPADGWVAVDLNKADWKINPTHYTDYYEDVVDNRSIEEY